jgi:ATP-dependent exoDNAse (exonuclease V) beta subunit
MCSTWSTAACRPTWPPAAAAEIDEERRLLYVAMTRARERLHLLLPQRFHVSGQSGSGDRHVYASRSRFIPNRLLPHFEQITWPEAEIQTAARDETRQAAVDLAAKSKPNADAGLPSTGRYHPMGEAEGVYGTR